MTEDLLILGELIAEQAAHMDAAQHRLLTNIRQFDERGGWASAISCAHWLAWRVGWTLGTAREHVRVAKALGTLPHIDEALRLGQVSYCKVRAMTRVATPENEQVLLMDAKLTTGSQLERICRKYKQLQRLTDNPNAAADAEQRRVTRRELDNGMVMIQAVLHADEAALVWAAIERATKEAMADTRRGVLEAGVSAETHSEMTVTHEASPGADVSAETPAEVTVTHEAPPSADVSAETAVHTPVAAPRGSVAASSEPRARPPTLRNASPNSYAAAAHESSSCAEVPIEDVGRSPASVAADDDSVDGELVAISTTDCTSTILTEYYSLAEIEERQIRTMYRADADAFPNDPDQDAFGVESGGDMGGTIGGDLVIDTKRDRDAAPPASRRELAARFDRADGLVALARRFAMGDSARSPVEVIVTVSASSLVADVSDEQALAVLGDGTCLSPDAARRLSCDAGIVRMIEDDHGNVIGVGRRTRSIPTSIRRALLKRDTCCRFPGCTNRVYLEGHHIEHWAHGGETSLRNMLVLCGHHHRFVHEYGYRIEHDASGEPRFFDPRGRPVLDVPVRLSRDDLGWTHIELANRELAIVPHACGWDGKAVHYDDVCHVLHLVDEGRLTPDKIL